MKHPREWRLKAGRKLIVAAGVAVVVVAAVTLTLVYTLQPGSDDATPELVQSIVEQPGQSGQSGQATVTKVVLSPIEELGKSLFFDVGLSVNSTQSCATCHDPAAGFTGEDSAENAATGIYPGAVQGMFGNRRPPSAAYAGASPVLHYDDGLNAWVGGMFYDGRATGAALDDPLAENTLKFFLI